MNDLRQPGDLILIDPSNIGGRFFVGTNPEMLSPTAFIVYKPLIGLVVAVIDNIRPDHWYYAVIDNISLDQWYYVVTDQGSGWTLFGAAVRCL